jgi:hypothetical protein
MPTQVKLNGRVMHPNDGQPWNGAHINWTFVGFTTTATTQHPSDRGQAIAGPDGRWSVDLWVNQAGDYRSYYVFDFPSNRGIRVILTSDLPSEIEFSQAAIAAPRRP